MILSGSLPFCRMTEEITITCDNYSALLCGTFEMGHIISVQHQPALFGSKNINASKHQLTSHRLVDMCFGIKLYGLAGIFYGLGRLKTTFRRPGSDELIPIISHPSSPHWLTYS